jgi:uncharacterized protein DUF6940
MWQSHEEDIANGTGQKIRVAKDGASPTYAGVVNCWQHDRDFRLFFNRLLADVPYEAFRWETPAVTESTASRQFEFVVLDCPGLLTTPNPNAFAEYFGSTSVRDHVVSFANLGKDAVLVVPLPMKSAPDYGHIASFVRTAPGEQADALWRAVGGAMQARFGQKPVWLSTAGMGVAWLHVRLDDRPKYYGHAPYRDAGYALPAKE